MIKIDILQIYIECKRELRDILGINLKYIAAGKKWQTELAHFFWIWIARSVVSPIMRPSWSNWYRGDQMVFNSW